MEERGTHEAWHRRGSLYPRLTESPVVRGATGLVTGVVASGAGAVAGLAAGAMARG